MLDDAASQRKRRGAWYTPPDLVRRVVDAVVTEDFVAARAGRPIRVLDPACGDGRFLEATWRRIDSLGGIAEVFGVDIDAAAVDQATAAIASITDRGVRGAVIHADALRYDWAAACADGRFDVVVGNPPFLSQMAADTTRGGASERGGGPYADAAVEFMALAGDVVVEAGGRVAMVLPQSLLAARDAAPIRRSFDERATMIWSWWNPAREFDAQVHTCAVAFEFGTPDDRAASSGPTWSHVVTSRRAVPAVPPVIGEHQHGTLGDRVRLNANFRDEYYGMVPAVGDHEDGPRLITSGLIDPGRCRWGERPIRFAKQRFERPRIDLGALTGKMPTWAADRLVPKVLIANQTRIIEAVADPDGDMLPGVPVVAAYPIDRNDLFAEGLVDVWEVAAVLTSPVASAWAWHRSAGTGLSADAIRVGPVMLGALPWPAGSLDVAATALRRGDVRACARAVDVAFGLGGDRHDDDELFRWWDAALCRIEARAES